MTDQTLDWTADNQSAYDLFNKQLASWGLPSGPDIQDIIKQAVINGTTPDQIELILPDIQATQTWKNRFPGWDQRVKNGYNQITVGEYLALENNYHRILQEAGMPPGFYDDPSDFGNWIANNVSPDEIQNRVQRSMDLVRQVDPTARGLLTQFYGVGSGDLAAYFLDPSRALPSLERQYKAVNVASFAAKNGLDLAGPSHYEDLVDKGVTADMAAQGYGTVKAFADTYGKLGGIYGEKYTQGDAESDVFFNQNDKRRRLTAMEQANFSGSSRGATGTAARGTSY